MPVSREEAVAFLLDHYQNPQHKGHVDDPTFVRSGGNPGCADVVEISAQISANGYIQEIAFDGSGCTISMAAADIVVELAEGKTVDEIEAMTAEEFVDLLGREVVMTRPSCATAAFNVLKQAVHEHVMEQRAK